MITNILLRNGYIPLPHVSQDKLSKEVTATILMNLEYYGFALDNEAYQAFSRSSDTYVKLWWEHIEKELKDITGDNRNIGDFVVYKNFPAEVLNKTEAEYWIPQILMYWGFPNNLFTEEVKPRKGMKSKERSSKILKPVGPNTLHEIFTSLLKLNARWKDQEFKDAVYFSESFAVDFAKINFKENLVLLAKTFIDNGKPIHVKTATDVLRLGVGLCGGDVSLKENVKFSYNRKTRKYLIAMLESCNNLEEDVAMRKGKWKKFLHQLHPGDYKTKCPKLCKVADELYNNKLETFNSRVEALVVKKDIAVLDLLLSRPGVFMRQLVRMLDVFGPNTIDYFDRAIPKLSTFQILSIKRHIETASQRKARTFPPKGNWAKLQIGKPRKLKKTYVKTLSKLLGKELSERVSPIKHLDKKTTGVKLATNGSDTGTYNRGTVFDIPENVKFIRTASYWRLKSSSYVWFDNGWNFFNENWESLGACCWNSYQRDGSVFSGDPTNSKEMKGRAAQLIDLYPDKLLKGGVRYAVWNILCYSNIPFSQAEDVFAALQWGEKPQSGKLFEPSRCQLSFPLTGDYRTKYICMIDLKERKMIYLDANFKGSVRTAEDNGTILSKTMPAFMEYLDTIPSVYDLFSESVSRDGMGQVLYSDSGVEVNTDEPVYIFKKEKKVKYNELNLSDILNT